VLNDQLIKRNGYINGFSCKKRREPKNNKKEGSKRKKNKLVLTPSNGTDGTGAFLLKTGHGHVSGIRNVVCRKNSK
jgi:hypothetical protein